MDDRAMLAPNCALGPATMLARASLLAIALAGAGCQRVAIEPKETFNWGDQPIAFAPPGNGWRREGELSGGVRGIRFIKERSVGEAVGIGNYYLLGDRSRVARLGDLLDKFDTYDRRGFSRAVALARSRTDDAFSTLESEVAENVNAALDRAIAAHINGDRDGARAAIADAQGHAGRLQFALDDVLDRVSFDPQRRQEPERYQLLGRRDIRIGGEPAVVIDYTRTTSERVYYGREAYVVRNNHLFIATFIGLKENLALFDRVIASVEFPA